MVAFAVAALIEGRVDAAWARWVRPWALAAWCFLTLGIALGSWWAYYILGWGGFWFWDPVENASLMPWLAGTALLHSAAVTDKRGLFRGWTILLAILAFALSLIAVLVQFSYPFLFAQQAQGDMAMLAFPIFIVVMAIIQPRAPHRDGPIRVWETDPISVLEFEADLREVAFAVDNAALDYAAVQAGLVYREPCDERYLNPGEWCRFCKALPGCPAARQKALDAAREEFMPDKPLHLPALTPDRLGALLDEAEFQKMRWKAIEEFAHQEALAGRSPVGWKLVAKRAMRKWKREDEAVASLALAGSAIGWRCSMR